MDRENLSRYFDDVCGYDSVKQDLIYLCDVMRNPEPYKALGARIPRNLMLTGAPGVGKTLMSECLIKASGRKAFRLHKDDADEDFVETLTDTFAQAREEAPSIVFLDDMDKYANGYFGRSAEETAIQACIDEMRDEEVFVIATVNEYGGISKSLKRSGRFDRTLHIDLPDKNTAVQIIKRYFRDDKNISDDIDIEYLVDLTGGMSAVEIRTLANEAGVYAGYDRSEVIKMDHIVRAFAGRASNSMIDNHIDNKERAKVTAYHEAGHAVISDLLRRGSVGFVFLGKEAGESEGFMSMARGNAGVGVNHYRHDILTGLGGRAATELVFGRPDRGAGADLSKVISAINCELTWLCVDGIELAENRSSYIEPSMARRNSIDKLSRDKLKAYYAETKAMLEDNRKLLDMVAGALEEKGYLLSEDISRIRNEYESERSGR